MKKPYDHTGRRFGNLVALRLVSTSPTKWECLCDCGNTRTIRTSHFARGATRSCGCLMGRSTGLRNKARTNPETFRTILYKGYVQSAKRRGHTFDLTVGEMTCLIRGLCFYCGREPSQAGGKRLGGSFLRNGIDRIVNTLGYTASNCRSCCSRCNYAKHMLSEQEFKKLILEIYNHWASK